MNKKYIYGICAVVILAIGLLLLHNRSLSVRLSALDVQYQTNQAVLQDFEAENLRLKADIKRRAAEIKDLQKQNDARVKEAIKSAYTQAKNIPVSSVDAAMRQLVADASERNRERERSQSVDF